MLDVLVCLCYFVILFACIPHRTHMSSMWDKEKHLAQSQTSEFELCRCVFFTSFSGLFFTLFLSTFLFPPSDLWMYVCFFSSIFGFRFCVYYFLPDFVLRHRNKRIRHMHVKNEKITLHIWATRANEEQSILIHMLAYCVYLFILRYFLLLFFSLLWFCFLSSVVDASNFFSYYENEIEIEKKGSEQLNRREEKIDSKRTNEWIILMKQQIYRRNGWRNDVEHTHTKRNPFSSEWKRI